MVAEIVGAIAAASGGAQGRVRVRQYTLSQRRRLRYFYIGCESCARQKNRGDGRDGGRPSKRRLANSASAKAERMSLAHGLPPWMGASRYDSTYPRFDGIC